MMTSLHLLPKSRRLHFIVLAAMCVAILCERAHTFHEPLDRDITTYAIIGHELLNGRRIYSDVWDHKPPGIHVSFAAAELLAGYGDGAVYLLGTVLAIATLGSIYWASGLWGAALWTAICSDMMLQANQPNTE